ncbi:MAG: hypothetical protein AAFW47_02005, partial [Pseudomonadota bacterium]
MSVLTLADSALATKRAEIDAAARRRTIWLIASFAIIFGYLVFSYFYFDLASAAKKWSPERASLFVLDTYAHKDHVSMRWKEPDKIDVAFEGGFRHKYDPPPAWFVENPQTGGRTVNFDNGGRITFFDDHVVMSDWPKAEQDYVFRRDAEGKPYVEGFADRPDELPSWMRATENKVEVRPSLYERLQVYTSKVEVHRYEIGWKYFWFDFDSPLKDYSLFQAIGTIFSGERIDPEQSNASLVLNEFLENDIWLHNTVLFSLVETVLMALLGTMIASIVSLPLAFMAAKNLTPLPGLRFVLRRFFDFLRG